MQIREKRNLYSALRFFDVVCDHRNRTIRVDVNLPVVVPDHLSAWPRRGGEVDGDPVHLKGAVDLLNLWLC